MTRQITEQFATFWFAIDGRLPDDESAYDELHGVWKRALQLIQERQKVHPLRVFEVQEGGDTFEVERWELCEPEAYLEARAGKLAWPVTFHHGKAFEFEALKALAELCTAAFTEAAESVPVEFVEATAHTVYRETVDTILEGL